MNEHVHGITDKLQNETVCFVTASTPFGTGEEFVWPEIAVLASQGTPVFLFPLRGGYRARRSIAVPSEITVWRFPPGTFRAIAAAISVAYRYTGRTFMVLGLVIRNSGGHRHRLKNIIVFGRGLTLAWLCERHGVRHIHAHWGSTTATAAYIAASILGVSWSCSLHRWDIYDANMLTLKAASAKFIRCVSQEGAQDTCARLSPGLRTKVHMVHLGVSVATQPARCPSPARINDAPIHIVSVARFVPVKGHEVLLQALQLLMEHGVPFRATLIGSGPLYTEIVRYCGQLGMSRLVSFAGQMPHAEVLHFYRDTADIAVSASLMLPGNVHEGIPVSLMEAMEAGLAVIATDSGATKELVSGAGILVPCNDAVALARALEELVTDDEERRRIGRLCRQRVADGWDASGTANQLLNLMCSSDNKG